MLAPCSNLTADVVVVVMGWPVYQLMRLADAVSLGREMVAVKGAKYRSNVYSQPSAARTPPRFSLIMR